MEYSSLVGRRSSQAKPSRSNARFAHDPNPSSAEASDEATCPASRPPVCLLPPPVSAPEHAAALSCSQKVSRTGGWLSGCSREPERGRERQRETWTHGHSGKHLLRPMQERRAPTLWWSSQLIRTSPSVPVAASQHPDAAHDAAHDAAYGAAYGVDDRRAGCVPPVPASPERNASGRLQQQSPVGKSTRGLSAMKCR